MTSDEFLKLIPGDAPFYRHKSRRALIQAVQLAKDIEVNGTPVKAYTWLLREIGREGEPWVFCLPPHTFYKEYEPCS